MNKTVASVIDDINEWENPRGGSVFYVTAIFTDETVGSVGRKDHDVALEVQGLLRESIGVEQDFTLEPAGSTKTGRDKFKIKGFGTPGGAATYTAPGVQGDGVSRGGGTPITKARPPEHDVDASIRAAVALKAAIQFLRPAQEKTENGEATPALVMAVADWMYEWLQRKASEPALSAYNNGSGTVTPVVDAQAGVGSEDIPQEIRPLPADSAGLVGSGEGEAPEPTQHIHDYQLRQGVRGFLVCECGKTRKKAEIKT